MINETMRRAAEDLHRARRSLERLERLYAMRLMADHPELVEDVERLYHATSDGRPA